MITSASIIGIAGCALLMIYFGLIACRARRQSFKIRAVLLLAGIVLALWPVGGLPLAGYLRGFTGDLSVTTLILTLSACISIFVDKEIFRQSSLTALLFLVVAGAQFLYPFALGLTNFDPYSLGYGSTAFAVVLSLLCLVAWYLDLYLVLLCVTLAIIAFLLGLFESNNLWDYLIDPWISLYASIRIIKGFLSSHSPLERIS